MNAASRVSALTAARASFPASCFREEVVGQADGSMRACGLAKPVSQYALGRPDASHLASWSWRCSRPRNQLPSVDASQLPPSHSAGMRALNSASSASISGPLSATVPAPRARCPTWKQKRRS